MSIRIVPLVLVAVVLAGCGSDSGAGASESSGSSVASSPGSAPTVRSGGGDDPCALLTVGEVAAVLGVGQDTVPSVSNPGSDQCEWKLSGSVLGSLTLTLTSIGETDAAAIAQAQDLYKSSFMGDPVGGLGVYAAFYDPGTSQKVMHAYDDRVVVELAGFGGDVSGDPAGVEQRYADAVSKIFERAG